MLSQEQQQQIAPKIQVAQIIGAAMVMGAIFFSVGICFVANWEEIGVLKLITLIGAFTGFTIFVLSFIISFMFPKIPAGKEITVSGDENRETAAIDSILRIMTTEAIVRAALIEGAILLNLMVFMLEPHLISLVVVGIGILLMAALIPWPTKAMSRVEDRLRDFRDSEALRS